MVVTPGFRTGWYLLYTRPYQEKRVHAQLSDVHIDSFLPMKKGLRIWHDRKKIVDQPLFPSYIFIHLNNMQEYYDGMEMDGVVSYVKIGKTIAHVHESIIQSIRVVADRDLDLQVSEDRFLAGKRLVISQGPLTGLTCEVVEFNSKQKLLVRVELLNRNLLVSMPSEYLTEL